ncbi:universal stress protein [Oscillochloris sp. ZM17-4]|uniref:universal stress protein n=1 Tax=Oscillochloris sp. ZM17-4 TaxID=2866714 RepID=UPI001C735042|nr:universal stress protein [Oscillochloris sp. ZM17-4]MBX0327443.1 universal stress protein [Oscillochloris sp. ZM17-4]
MFQTIMVPLDGSPTSEQAIAAAARLAQGSSAALHLVHVHSPYTTAPISIEGLPVIDEELRSLAVDHELAYLHRTADGVAGTFHKPVIARLEGPVAFRLASYCHAIGADLLVMTTHGRSGFTQLWLGSVAEALLRSLHVPMLLLRPTPEAATPQPFRHIIVPLDGSALAEQILPHAVAMAEHDGAEITLLRIIEGHPAHILGNPIDYRPHESSVTEQRDTAELYLSRLAAELLAGGHPAHTAIEAADGPAQAILAAAEGRGADLIALATRGRSGMASALLGSVADKIIRGGALPVLALRPSHPDG